MITNNKYIDMDQFVHNKNGTISWKNSVGIIVDFLFNNNYHQIEIMDFIDSRHIKIKIDNDFIKVVQSGDIVNLSFEKLLHESKYNYDIGDIINDVEILEKIKIKQSKSKKYLQKAYKCRCLVDGYVFDISECDLNRGRGCPLCANKIVVCGVNDIATTNPEIIKYLRYKKDAYRYTAQSNKKIDFKCPICGFIKSIPICSFYSNGFSCDMCSDGISYPNKFAHELFRQLSDQYIEYEYEYSPYWAKNYRYDNYIKLLNNKDIIIEMDGAYHFIDGWNNNDEEKDSLAKSYGIDVVRVNCNYSKTTNRFEHIKNNVINSLSNYFDLSSIDWDRCDLCATSSIIIDVIKYYNNNKRTNLCDIAKHFGICVSTLRNYLNIGERLGLCQYKK